MARRVLCLLLLLALAPMSAAGEDQKPETKRSHSLRAAVYEKLEEAQKAEDAGNVKGALAILDGMKGDESLSEYERAMVWNLIGSLRFAQDDVAGAIAAFQSVLAQKDIPEGMRTTVMYGLAQLHFAAESYTKTLEVLREWRALVKEPSADAYALEAQAHYQLEQYAKAVPPLLEALKLAKQQKLRFKESWLGLLRAAYYELGEHEKAAKVLELLVAMYPKKPYWIQLAGLYGLLGREKNQLATMEAAWEQGFLDQERELVNLAQLFLYHEVPYKAVKVFEAGLAEKRISGKYENLRLYAQALALAQETKKQVSVMEEAAKVAPDGEMNVYLGQAWAEQGEWEKAARSYAEAIRKGVRRKADTNVMLGIAHFNAGNLDASRKAFQQALREDRETPSAVQWLAHVEAEEKRREYLASAAAHGATETAAE